MTDYWSRPGGSGQPDFEIQLIGEDGAFEASAPRRGEQPPRRQWGAVVGLAALGAIGLLVAGSVVIQLATDGGADDAEPASTTLQVDLAPAVTSTLPTESVDGCALCEFDAPEARYPPMASAPGFPVEPGSAEKDLSAYDLDTAVVKNMPGADPQRSMFNIVGSELIGSATTGGSGPPPVRATAAFEPDSARDALTIESEGDTSRLIVDRARQVVYALGPADEDEWQMVDLQELLTATGAGSLGALFDAFVTGPITPAALEHSTITPAEGLQRITGGGFARRFDVEVPVDYLRPYGALLLANVSDGSIGSDAVPDTITFQVYVNRQAQLALVTSNFMVGPQNFVLSQFFDRKPANVRIELPEVEAGAALEAPTP